LLKLSLKKASPRNLNLTNILSTALEDLKVFEKGVLGLNNLRNLLTPIIRPNSCASANL